MNLEKSLKKWVDTHLLEQDQADKILQFENSRPSPSWVLVGISGLGIVVMMTGLISIIAANWSAISPITKLVGYFTVLAALSGLALNLNAKNGAAREGVLVALGLSILAGIGLIGQIYNLQSDGYSALFLWLCLTLPLTLLAKSGLASHLWFLILFIAMGIWFNETALSKKAAQSLTVALPFLLLGMGYRCGHVNPQRFFRTARIWSYGTLLMVFGLWSNLLWSRSFFYRPAYATEADYYWSLVSVGSVVFALVCAANRKIQVGQFITRAISFVMVTAAVLILVPLTFDVGQKAALGCALFILAWSGAAAVAAANREKRLFDCIALVIGIRFIIVYFEVFGSLAATGIGLIFSGLIILGVAYLWHRYRGDVAVALQEKV